MESLIKQNNQESKEVLEKKAKIILNGDAHELQKMYDFCTEVSGDIHPKSATKVGTETLQTAYFPQIFDILKETTFFKSRISPLLEEVSYETFLDFVAKAYKNDEAVKVVDAEVLKKIIHATIKFCDLFQSSILPAFEFDSDEEMKNTQFKNSDIIVNLINNINTKAQVIQMGL